jgi:hypothetical protein
MKIVRQTLTVLGFFTLAGWWSAEGPAKAQAAKGLPLTPAEEQAVTVCLHIIRGCQLPDGAFVQVKHGANPNSPVWVAPYFGNYAALALLAGHERKKTPADLERVERWLEWCAQNQAADGYWNDFEGTVAGYRNNGKVDVWDSSAAMFLLVAGRYQRTGGKARPSTVAAARKALRCIETVTDGDGLTWASPTYKVKYLMDNTEVYAGLRAGADFFTAADAQGEARKASDHARLIAKKLPEYWVSADRLFAFALHENGMLEGGLVKTYPHGLAQLFGIAFVAPKAEAWAALQKFPADAGPAAPAGTEWWLVAASRLGGNDARKSRAKVVREVASFTPQNVYVNRPGIAALSLLEGADWMPSLASRK